MTRLSRPNPGQHFRFAILIAGLALACGLTACAPKEESKADAWKLTPPMVEMQNARGISVKLSATEFQMKNGIPLSLVGDDASLVRFALPDRGFSATAHTSCQSENAPVEEHIEKFTTSASVSFLKLLPPVTISPKSFSKTWKCAIKLAVTNEKGSTSAGEIANLKFNFSKLNSRFENSEVIPIEGAATRRLVCSNWWTDSKSRESRESALEEMAHVDRVEGQDSRPWERQPLCTVLETFSTGDSEKTVFSGLSRPKFVVPPSIAVTDRNVLAPAEPNMVGFFRMPIMAWTVRNTSAYTQLIFVPTTEAGVKASVSFGWAVGAGGWTMPTRLLPQITVTGADDWRETKNGFFARIRAGGEVRLTMHANRPGSTAMVHFNGRDTRYIALDTTTPLKILTISNERDFGSLSAQDWVALEGAVTDPDIGDQHVLLQKLILEPNYTTKMLQASAINFADAINSARKLPGPAAFTGPNILQAAWID